MIDLDNVAFRYGDRLLFSAAQLHVQPGDFYFLTGPSGAGKTTLIKLCYLDLAPDEGAVSLFGASGAGLSRDEIAKTRQRIGVEVDSPAIFEDLVDRADALEVAVLVAGRVGIAGEEDDAAELQQERDTVSKRGPEAAPEGARRDHPCDRVAPQLCVPPQSG